MRFFVDENIPAALSKVLHYLSATLPGSHSVHHATEIFERGTPDVVWIENLSKDGDWVIISKDRFKKGDPEILAYKQANITTLFLDKEWNKNSYEQTIRISNKWQQIIETIGNQKHPYLWEIPWRSRKQMIRKNI